MRTGRGVCKQHLHITRPHILTIGLIGAANITGNAANHFQQITVIETRWCQTFRVVQRQNHLCIIARRTRRCTGEDHILHAAATHGGGSVFTHHPTQSFQQIRLSTPVRTNNAC